ncbi:MAG: asparagine synthase (glutamine-hydrolyzing), partial [Proteobacteria bacterium]|nr:asparagine synthase (glutamine-hydrolyzing) [Pseudomonadota bacterium]
MCGICGKLSNCVIKPDEVRRMANTLSHRGPDDEGFYFNTGIGMGHRRLSIIDLKSGRQPISNEDQSIWIVYNGEIYNYKILRKDLKKKGHIFRTNTDTEVIVHLYEELGERCVEKLSGMFAFAIWDDKAKKLFLARDRIGQKPIFYAQNGNGFLFASEVKAILAEGNIDREIDTEAIHHYLSLRFIPSPQTMFRKIKKLPPGHYLTYQDGAVRISRYWDLYFQEKLNLREDEFIDCLKEKLTETVESHLVSDVPVGAFLSGGMDTSMIVAIMGNLSQVPFKTFSIGVKEQDYNELPYARMVAEQYGTEHIEQIVEANLIKLIPQMIWHLDEPSDPIAACMFHAAKLASEHVKVVLGGDGGDELFAGFDRYMGMGMIDYYNLIPTIIRSKLLGPFIDLIPDSFAYKSLAQKMRWAHQLSSYQNGERYAEATAFFRFNHQEKRLLFSDSLWRGLQNIQSTNIITDQYNKANADDPIDKMLYADFMTRLSEHTLMLTDRMNMAHGLEARSPYLDHSLVELLAAFPSNIKIHGKRLKYVLRQLAKDYLPSEIVKRDKQGFMFPVAYWFRNELYAFIKSFLMESKLLKEGFFRKERVLELIEDHRNNRIDNHVRIWMLLNLEIWYRIY